MKQLFLILILIGSLNFLYGQELNMMVMDTVLHREVLVGNATREALQTGEFAPYYSKEYSAYRPDSVIIHELAGDIHQYTFTIVMGTWCSDSREQVPRFYKILDELGVKDDRITLIAVNRSKKAGSIDISALDIERVPTFIIYRDGKEVGRIIETPVKSLEEDLLNIILKSQKPLEEK
jgi:thiol-disulfide isomerase/thioredoxin